MMRFQNALANARLALQISLLALALLFVGNILLVIAWRTTQTQMTIHLPPQIPMDGMRIQANQIPESTIFSFAYYIWQSINDWPTNGTQDYPQAIQQFSPYLTPQFKAFLLQDYHARFNQSEIQDRLRTLQGLNGSAFNNKDVDYIGHDTWLVHLHMRLTEHMNLNGNQVKDVAIDYVLRVVRYSIDANTNRWGLALDGFSADPQRIQTFT